MNIIIRKETKEDYHNTELMVMRAFFNMYRPGCNGHLLVHKLREEPEYVPECSLVAELDGRIVGCVFTSRANVTDGEKSYEVVTIGPVAVEPTLCYRSIGTKLMEAVIPLIKEAGFKGIVMCGEPEYYPRFGFVTCDRFDIHHNAFGNSDAFMALPLNEGFEDIHGIYAEGPVFETCEDEAEIAAFNQNFPYMKPMKLSEQPLHKLRLGRISEVGKNSYRIQYFGEELQAKLKGNFYNKEPEELPVVGDYVIFIYNPAGESLIKSVCERTSFLKRPDQEKTAVMQYMAANTDYVFIVTSLNEDYSYNRIARYASVALAGGATPVAVLTKSDLCRNVGRYVTEVETISEKIRVHAISALYGIGLDELEEYFKPGATVCFLGSSGAGKSTLLNALAGEEVMKTSAIRESDGEGRHTTTRRQLINLKNGVSIIDTPGMREIGMASVQEGLDDTFSDILELESRCRFSDCRHLTEPGCAIKAALADGTLSEQRYMLYKDLSRENRSNYALKKQISKWHHQMEKMSRREED